MLATSIMLSERLSSIAVSIISAMIIISCHPRDTNGKSLQSFLQPDATAVSNADSMVLIPGGTFMMGGDNEQAAEDEYPKHSVFLDSFWMDTHEVTNAEFARFVKATGYITTAERKPDWEEMKKTLPPDVQKPDESQLVAASLVFSPPKEAVDLNDYSQWWKWVPGADWKHPEGPESNIINKENYPVVHVSWEDATAYCKWANKKLPTEAQWEYAARGGLTNDIYPWGNEPVNAGKPKANTWEGNFPNYNSLADGFAGLAPVGSFKPNGYGLYDMAGNVWEWCADWYRNDYYKTLSTQGTVHNPQGPPEGYDPDEPYMPKKTIRGGSFMCNESYCTGYRVARRMKTSPDSGTSNTGFRCVRSVIK
jgi:formylglycine-generating enzyme